jgi:hypothetical protein
MAVGTARGSPPGAIKRELSALKRMFNLGLRRTPPRIERAPEETRTPDTRFRKTTTRASTAIQRYRLRSFT